MLPSHGKKFEVVFHISMFQFLVISSLQNWKFIETIFLAGFAGPGVLNKDPTVWLDGARPTPISFIGLAIASK